MDRFVLKMLAKRTKDRHKNTHELLAEFRNIKPFKEDVGERDRRREARAGRTLQKHARQVGPLGQPGRPPQTTVLEREPRSGQGRGGRRREKALAKASEETGRRQGSSSQTRGRASHSLFDLSRCGPRADRPTGGIPAPPQAPPMHGYPAALWLSRAHAGRVSHGRLSSRSRLSADARRLSSTGRLSARRRLSAGARLSRRAIRASGPHGLSASGLSSGATPDAGPSDAATAGTVRTGATAGAWLSIRRSRTTARRAPLWKPNPHAVRKSPAGSPALRRKLRRRRGRPRLFRSRTRRRPSRRSTNSSSSCSSFWVNPQRRLSVRRAPRRVRPRPSSLRSVPPRKAPARNCR